MACKPCKKGGAGWSSSSSSTAADMPLVIAKTVLPDAQKFYLALGRIFGIGRAQGLAIAEEVGISKEARVSDVKASHVRQVSTYQLQSQQPCPSTCAHSTPTVEKAAGVMPSSCSVETATTQCVVGVCWGLDPARQPKHQQATRQASPFTLLLLHCAGCCAVE